MVHKRAPIGDRVKSRWKWGALVGKLEDIAGITSIIGYGNTYYE
jgi:hypothetical protein